MANETKITQTGNTAPLQQQTQQSFSIEKLRGQVLSNLEIMIKEKMLSAPPDYKEEIFFAFQIMAELPDIEKCTAKDICNEMVRKVFRKGLCVSKNHCAMMVMNSRKSPTGKALSIRDQYQGLEFVAKRDCGVIRSTPVLVYENDNFDYEYINGIIRINIHKPPLTDRGNLIGGYCIVEYQNNNIQPRWYDKKELDSRRNKSQEETVWENRMPVGKTESRFWREWEREMYEKTLINATLKRIIETSPNTIKDEYDEQENDVKQTNRYVDINITPQNDPLEQQKHIQNNVNSNTGEIIIPENEQVNLLL
jgi:recombinational DNA repair protein RecT